MGVRGIWIFLVLLLCLAVAPLHAADQAPSESITLTSNVAATWTEGSGSIVLLHGPVKIVLENATLTADNAVVWLNISSQDNFDIQEASIALVGHAKLAQAIAMRTGDELFVTAQVRGDKVRIVADERVARDESKSDLFQKASALRNAQRPTEVQAAAPAAHPATSSATRPHATPVKAAALDLPIIFEADSIQTLNGDDGNVAITLGGGVHLIQRRPNGDYLELGADRAVLFTPLKSLKELMQRGRKKQGNQVITSAYLEGDVRIDYVVARPHVPEQRLTADSCYYEFATDRAILTQAIIHTLEPQRNTPIVMRAKVIRQLSQGEYATQNVQLTNSSFAVPTYSLAAQKLYMRTEPTGDPRLGDRVVYRANNTMIESFGIPLFFLPYTAGEMTEHGLALRALGGGHDKDFGTYATTTWGLFESLGQAPPRDIDANYHLDYFGSRGPGFGLNAAYGGGTVTDTSRQPIEFEGEFKSYFVYDKGTDDVGRYPVRVDNPQTLRGQVLWEHQHYFPDGWQAQARLGYVSDPTFMEQWFRFDFDNGPPHDEMAYIKHQADTEAFTFGVVWQPMRIVTNSNYVQEQFEVDRLPEIGYYREGDGAFNDRVTTFSENNVTGLHFARSRDSLADQGFRSPFSPGLPAEGYTGLTGGIVWRGDFRQEADFPFSLGPLRVDPYVMGRYTEYSDSPQHAERSRGMVAAGARISTQLWKVDPTAQSEILDIHQLRHIIEPQVNVFTSAMNVNRNQVYIYDEQVDAINDISAAQFAIHQKWETKRGGPGQWRSVDIFTLNLEVNAFENKPGRPFKNPYDFRGLFFSSYPEESVPRDSLNLDGSWRLSDNTVVLGDMSYNLDRGSLQTLAVGVLVRRDVRTSYFVQNRYIAELHSNITSLHFDYQMTPKYLLDVDQQFDFTQGKNVVSSFAIVRQFDTVMVAFRYYYDETTKENGIGFNLYPIGLGAGLDTSSFNTYRR